MSEMDFDIKIRSNKKQIDRIKGDWDKCMKSINDKYDFCFKETKKKRGSTKWE